MKTLLTFLVLAICLIWPIGVAQACSCKSITPEAGFDQAQYVFSGKVVKAEHHIWLLDVDRVWKGDDRLTRTVELMDVYAQMDCAFYFKLGERYVVFAVLGKGGRHIFFHPQACNWTRPLQSTRVVDKEDKSLWLEDLIVREHGPGEPPPDAHS